MLHQRTNIYFGAYVEGVFLSGEGYMKGVSLVHWNVHFVITIKRMIGISASPFYFYNAKDVILEICRGEDSDTAGLFAVLLWELWNTVYEITRRKREGVWGSKRNSCGVNGRLCRTYSMTEHNRYSSYSGKNRMMVGTKAT
ncbi:hypothetical protein L195_g048455 [Trifolium pratense]|uniref:Uncharacterized protein n=1 Tax=Trifolium pratense TaxID=57577 RepID=A0A2K3JLC5_TRIPR|nr:hypothetical protein L195_g048455 [Trifolium pratense]